MVAAVPTVMRVDVPLAIYGACTDWSWPPAGQADAPSMTCRKAEAAVRDGRARRRALRKDHHAKRRILAQRHLVGARAQRSGPGHAPPSVLFAAAVAGLSGLAAVVRLRRWGVVARGASAWRSLHAGSTPCPRWEWGGMDPAEIFGVLFQPVFGVYPDWLRWSP